MAGYCDREREGMLVPALALQACAQTGRCHISYSVGQSKSPGHMHLQGPGGCKPTLCVQRGGELKYQRMALKTSCHSYSKSFYSYLTDILFLMQLWIRREQERHWRPSYPPCANTLKLMRLCLPYIINWIDRSRSSLQEYISQCRKVFKATKCFQVEFTARSSLVDCTSFRSIVFKWCTLPQWSRHKMLDISIHPKAIHQYSMVYTLLIQEYVLPFLPLKYGTLFAMLVFHLRICCNFGNLKTNTSFKHKTSGH